MDNFMALGLLLAELQLTQAKVKSYSRHLNWLGTAG